MDVIDLRKKNNAQHEPIHSAPVRVKHVEQQALPPAPVYPEIEAGPDIDLEWSSYEHEYRVRGRYWILYPVVIATIAIVFAVLMHNYLFIAFIVISFTILVYYAKKAPEFVTYRIEKRGVWMGDKLFDFGRVKGFAIFKHPLMVSELLLETEHPLISTVHIRLENVDPEIVKEVISRYVPEKEHKDRAPEQIARIIGF